MRGESLGFLPPCPTLVCTLDEGCRAPRKQRHTVQRINHRILRELPDAWVAESTVRNHVRERKRQSGLLRRETFVPQSYS